MLVPAFQLEYKTRSNAGMLFLKVLNEIIGFNQLFKFWGLVPPGEWNVLSTLNNIRLCVPLKIVKEHAWR